MPKLHPEKERRRGSAIVETALMVPWIFFLFVGVFDLGFYYYAADCTQNAARAAALANSTGSLSNAIACTAALGEMTYLPNASQFSSTCNAAPLTVTVVRRDAKPPACADCGVDPDAASSFATVTYQSIPMIPIPGVLMGRLNITRTAEVRIAQ
jgi:Flp pilus assembly protein TadG